MKDTPVLTLTEFSRRGGKARAEKLSARRRSQISSAASKKRWRIHRRKMREAAEAVA